MFPYADETFSEAEVDLLRRYVTDVSGPVFALVNLPEVVKGALFARYSRSAKSLRRLFLDEFVGDLDVTGDAGVDATVGLARAETLYDRVFLEYGDDSVAQLGGVHLACEQASNLLTKILERGRLMSYLEQSTRYVGYDSRLPTGHYRYHRDPDVLASPLGARYVGEMDAMFDTYAGLLPAMTAWLHRRFPPEGEPGIAHRQAVRAKALDALRGLLPAGSLSNVGIFGTAQGYEQLVLRLRAHPLPEARRYGELVLGELRKVVPSFMTRLDRPDRGGVWADYLRTVGTATADVVARLWPEEAAGPAGSSRPGAAVGDGPVAVGSWVAPSGGSGTPVAVDLVDWDPDGEDHVLAGIAYPHVTCSDAELLRRVRTLGAEERRALLDAHVGQRQNRRHRPGRALERTSYRFDVICDYGAFRDLQRHRMLTIDWQPLSPRLGTAVPELVDEAGLGAAYRDGLERSAALYDALYPKWPEQAPYAVALGFRVRFSLQLNAREAMHLIELRSGRQGHPTYRAVAQAMHRLIAERAGHRALAASMCFVDTEPHDLERLDAERRRLGRLAEAGEQTSAPPRPPGGALAPPDPPGERRHPPAVTRPLPPATAGVGPCRDDGTAC
jgi:thymidylate synthase ThyX